MSKSHVRGTKKKGHKSFLDIFFSLPIIRHFGKEFFVYAFVGAGATILDWGTFYILHFLANLYYQWAVVFSTLLGGTTKFVFNKVITFNNRSKRLHIQYPLFVLIMGVALLSNMLLMYLFVELFSLNAMLGRVFATAIVLFINYGLDKYITFSKRFFNDE